MTEAQILAITGSLLSFIFMLTPGLKTWFQAQSKQRKAGLMTGLLFIATLIAILNTCSQETCDTATLFTVAQGFLTAVTTNQTTYALFKNVIPANSAAIEPA